MIGNYLKNRQFSKINIVPSISDHYTPQKNQYLPSDIKDVGLFMEHDEKLNNKHHSRNYSRHQDFYSITEVEADLNPKKFLYSGDKQINFNIFSTAQLQPSFLPNRNPSYVPLPLKEKLQKITKRYHKQITESIFHH